MISFIAAITRNNVMARGGTLPWHLQTDLNYYHDKVRDHMVAVGRNTYGESTHRLTNREIILITNDGTFQAEGVTVVRSIDEALAKIGGVDEEVMVIGGGQIFKQMLPYADRLYLTEIDIELEGDVFFPVFDHTQWHEVSREYHSKDADNDYDFDFVVYDRVN